MKNLYRGDYRLKGDRIVELPWIREKLNGVRDKDIADFGGIIRHGKYPRFGWWSFGIHESNNVTVYDADTVPRLAGQYIQVDLTGKPDIAPYDIGLCVSALEHMGVGGYSGNPKDMGDGDARALANIFSACKPDGVLYVTVPCGRGIRMGKGGWIREYSPGQLSALFDQLGAEYSVDTFWFEDETWYEVDLKTLVDNKAAEPKDNSIVTGLACVRVARAS